MSSFNIVKVFLASILLVFTHSVFAADTQTTETTSTSTVQTNNGPVTVEKRVITTTVPAAKETYVTPTGYVSCTSVPAAWVDNHWIPEHKVCTYQNSPEGVAWVDGYWSCGEYKIDSGECTNWTWVAAHWVKTQSNY